MIFIIPFIVGAIGAAIGAVGGAFAARGAGEKDRQEAKHHRKVANELLNKYSELQNRYYELEEESKAVILGLERQLILSEIEKDTLHLVTDLQQEIIQLMIAIDKEPSFKALENLKRAILFTNLALSKFDKQLILMPDDYIIRNLNRALNSTTDDKDRAYYFYLYGQMLHDEGKYQDAILCYDESINLDGLNHSVYLKKGKSLIDLGRYQESILTLNVALSINTNDAEIWSERALAYSLLGNSIEESKSYQHALCATSNYYQVCYENGLLYEEMKDKSQAIKYYNQAIKIKPDFAEAYYNRGVLFLDLGDPLSDVDYETYRQQAIEDLKISKKLFDEQGKQMPEIPDKSDPYLQIIFSNDNSIKYCNQVSIKACNDKYVMSQLNHHGKLAARAEHINQWEKFEIVSSEEAFSKDKNRSVYYGDKIALRAVANNKFVCSDLSNHGRLIANAPHVKEWETFILLPSQPTQQIGMEIEYGSKFILQIHGNKQVNCKVKEKGRICIDSFKNDASEIFIFIKPNN